MVAHGELEEPQPLVSAPDGETYQLFPCVVGEVGEIETVGASIVSPRDTDAVPPLESFAVIATICVAAKVGVPLIVPALFIERPLGRPLADHVYGELPPLAVTVAA